MVAETSKISKCGRLTTLTIVLYLHNKDSVLSSTRTMGKTKVIRCNPLTWNPVASAEEVSLNPPHPPHKNAIDAFHLLLPTIKLEILKSRHHWDKHERRMWSRAARLSDHELTSFDIEHDLVEVTTNHQLDVIITHSFRPLIDSEWGNFLWRNYFREDQDTSRSR